MTGKKLFLMFVVCLLFFAVQAQNRATWMKDAKWGVMIHYQTQWLASENKLDSITLDKWNEIIDNFDCDGLAKQLSDVGAGYLFITRHGPAYFIFPNAIYDHYTGISPSRCSRRDLVEDLSVALSKYGIKLIAYLPGPAPGRIEEEIKGFALDRNDNRKAESLLRWQEVIREYSIRWGDKMSGWWFDGCYRPNFMFRHADIPNFVSMAAAARGGNPNSILAFNLGVLPRIMSMTPYEDCTAGEINDPGSIVWKYNGDGMIDGRQIQILSFLGSFWGHGNPRFTEDQVIKYSKEINKIGGAITWDCPVLRSGLIKDSFFKQLAALGKVINAK